MSAQVRPTSWRGFAVAVAIVGAGVGGFVIGRANAGDESSELLREQMQSALHCRTLEAANASDGRACWRIHEERWGPHENSSGSW